MGHSPGPRRSATLWQTGTPTGPMHFDTLRQDRRIPPLSQLDTWGGMDADTVRAHEIHMKGKLLVIDDDQGMCDLLEHLLGREGYRVQSFTSAHDAMQVDTEEEFDL